MPTLSAMSGCTLSYRRTSCEASWVGLSVGCSLDLLRSGGSGSYSCCGSSSG